MNSNISNLINPVKLPTGYTQRAARLEDAEGVAQMSNIANQARGDIEPETAAENLQNWQNPNWDFANSAQVFLDEEGTIVGFAAVKDHNPAHPIIAWETAPNSHWQILGRAALYWAEQRALQALDRCPIEERFAPSMACYAESPNQVLIESAGYQVTRYFYELMINFQNEYVAQPMPEGFRLRVVDYPNELETVVRLYDETWQDYYSYIKRPIEDTMKEWQKAFESRPNFDPSVWYFVIEEATDEPVGFVICSPQIPLVENHGVFHMGGLRQNYRGRGIARAALTHVLAEFHRRGIKSVGMTTSTNSGAPQNVTSLYESVGMKRTRAFTRLEKEMRPGMERMVV